MNNIEQIMSDSNLKRILQTYNEYFALFEEHSNLYNRVMERLNRIASCKGDATIIKNECTIDIFGDVDLLSESLNNQILPIRYSYSAVRFDSIWSIKPIYDDKQRKVRPYIGSNPDTLNRLKNAVKYQLVANFHDVLSNMRINQLHLFAWAYAIKLQTDINNNMTYNSVLDEQGKKVANRTYQPVSVGCFNMNVQLIISEIQNGDFNVVDMYGKTHTLTDMTYQDKRLGNEELLALIQGYTQEHDKKPTINQLIDRYNQTIDWDALTIKERVQRQMTNPLMHKYITNAGYMDLIEIKHRNRKKKGDAEE